MFYKQMHPNMSREPSQFFKQKSQAALHLLNKMIVFSSIDNNQRNELVKWFKLFGEHGQNWTTFGGT